MGARAISAGGVSLLTPHGAGVFLGPSFEINRLSFRVGQQCFF
ncbi:hypothetical protein SAMN07250955_102134 [Arboricoccus pini]|uniref:Uncharacterized protein n=1 Tax=Arboricoccus pini TaxID=1963835 RepID=A0A212QP73_9PROT|nr:hypothetical protein SAMN07250955_102134 [Arboricoccus pini]